MSSTITVTRQHYWIFSARRFKIFIDGNHAGDVRDGKSVCLSVDPGLRQIQLKVDWSTSPRLTLDVGRDEEVRLICGITEGASLTSFFGGKDLSVAGPRVCRRVGRIPAVGKTGAAA